MTGSACSEARPGTLSIRLCPIFCNYLFQFKGKFQSENFPAVRNLHTKRQSISSRSISPYGMWHVTEYEGQFRAGFHSVGNLIERRVWLYNNWVYIEGCLLDLSFTPLPWHTPTVRGRGGGRINKISVKCIFHPFLPRVHSTETGCSL